MENRKWKREKSKCYYTRLTRRNIERVTIIINGKRLLRLKLYRVQIEVEVPLKLGAEVRLHCITMRLSPLCLAV